MKHIIFFFVFAVILLPIVVGILEEYLVRKDRENFFKNNNHLK